MSNVPTWERFMAPSLRVLADGEVHRARDICERAADELKVSPEDRKELINSGQPRYVNRANWALSYLARAGAAERPRRGQYSITDRGRWMLETYGESITEKNLRDLPDYESPYLRRTPKEELDSEVIDSAEPTDLAPIEQVEEGIRKIHASVAAELLDRLHAREPEFFEQSVLDLLVAMGYGGAEGTASRTQLSNDEGIDGVIDQDALGLSRIYVQAKRYALNRTVGRPEIQGFVGALHGKQADQGVFITTASYSSGAKQYVQEVASRVILIDGARLANLMIRYGVGVQNRETYRVVSVDEDYFE